MQIGHRRAELPQVYEHFLQVQIQIYKQQLPVTGTHISFFTKKIADTLSSNPESVPFRIQLGTEEEAKKIWNDPTGNKQFKENVNIVQYLTQ